MILNYLIIFILTLVLTFGIYKYLFSRKIITYETAISKFTLESLCEQIKDHFNTILKANINNMSLTEDKYNKILKNRNELRKGLKTCSYGDIAAKNYVKDFIKYILLKECGVMAENINDAIDFDNPAKLTVQDKFEILLYIYKKSYNLRALSNLITENELDRPRLSDGGVAFYITSDEIENVYNQKVTEPLLFEDKVNILTQRIFQNYKGYGVIDEIRDMHIDGVSGGVSGITTNVQTEMNFKKLLEDDSVLPYSFDSVWIFFKGKSVNLRFLSFGCEKELIRVCKNIYRYNNPGQLSESNGFKINDMKDGSRIVVARPPFAESWVFFVRKFDSAEQKDIEELITDENSSLVIELISWLVKSCRTFAITGSQGTGKTTLLMSIVKFINPAYNLRIQEMAFELNLRKIYPARNILSFRETSTISGQDGLDVQKKTDGTVNILGEVATAPVASWMIQMAQVASLFTIFTHHAKTAENLVTSLRNNLLQTGVFSSESVAEKQVADTINFDIHIEKDIYGHRYIERITEIVVLNSFEDYPLDYKGLSGDERTGQFMDNTNEFYTRMTDRKTYEARDIIVYEDGGYKTKNPLSKAAFVELCNHLETADIGRLCDYFKRNWGGRYE